MNRHFRMSLVLVALCLALVLVFAGCNKELEAKVDKNAADASAAVEAAAEKALADLEAAKAELKKLVADGDAASSAALTEKVEELNAAIAAAKKAATDADAALKTELEAAIADAQAAAEKKASDNLAAAKAELEAKIADTDETVTEEVEALNAAIEAAKTAATTADSALKTELEAAIKAAADAAAANLATAKNELNAAIQNLSNDSANALLTAKTELEAAIKAAQTAADNAGNGVTDLQKQINDANTARENAVKELKGLIKDVNDDLVAEVARLEALIATKADDDAVAEAFSALNGSIFQANSLISQLQNKTTSLEEAIKELEEDLNQAIFDTAAGLNKDWNDATDNMIGEDGYFAQYLEIQKTHVDLDTLKYYPEDAQKVINGILRDYYVRLMRVNNPTDAAQLLVDFEKALDDVPSFADAINAKLEEVRTALDAVDYKSAADRDAKLAAAKTLLDQAKALIDNVPAEAMDEVTAYGADKTDLTVVYTEYYNDYVELAVQINAQELKEAIDTLLTDETVVTLDLEDEINTIITNINNWVANTDPVEGGANFRANPRSVGTIEIDGWFASYEKLSNASMRVVELHYAKDEADVLNGRIEDLEEAINTYGPTITNKNELDDIKADIETWVKFYFTEAPYGDTYAYEVEADTDNYNLVDHEGYTAVADLFAAEYEKFIVLVTPYLDAVNALPNIDRAGRVTLLAKGAVATADAEYAKLLNSDLSEDAINNIDFMVVDLETETVLGEFTNRHFTIKAAYLATVEEALEAYIKAVVDAKGECTSSYEEMSIQDITLYDGEIIAAVRAWFSVYAPEFELNNDRRAYYLNDTYTVTEVDYLKLCAFEEQFDLLVAQKAAEKAYVEGLIAAIYEDNKVTYADKAAIELAEEKYDAWKAGTNTDYRPENTNGAANFDVVDGCTIYTIANYDKLTAARGYWNKLDADLAAIKTSIENLGNYAVSDDFADIAERNVTSSTVAGIYAAIDAFKTANGGDLETAATELAVPVAKLENVLLAVYKYDAVVALEEKADGVIAGVGTIADVDHVDEIVAVINTIVANEKKAINDTVVNGTAAETKFTGFDLACAKIYSIGGFTTEYDALYATAAPEKLPALWSAFITNVEEAIAAATSIESVYNAYNYNTGEGAGVGVLEKVING